MEKVRTEIHIWDFPHRLRHLFENAAVYDSSSRSGATVLYLDTGYYVKIHSKGALAEEAARGRFFHSLGLGLEVIDYLSRDRDYLVTRAAEGEDLTHCLQDPQRLCRVLAQALRRLHSCPAEGMGISPAMEQYLDAGPEGDGNGWAVTGSFPMASVEEARDLVRKNRCLLKADTMIHGDACLPNVIMKDGEFSVFIDFGQAGAGDRHIDLFWAVWSLEYNLKTDAWTEYFLDCYGRTRFDRELLRLAAAIEFLAG